MFWAINVLNGLSLAMILFILAAGLTLIFGLMQIINMAHGSFYLLGAYIALVVMQRTGKLWPRGRGVVRPDRRRRGQRSSDSACAGCTSRSCRRRC